jgi:hypothetical protein
VQVLHDPLALLDLHQLLEGLVGKKCAAAGAEQVSTHGGT